MGKNEETEEYVPKKGARHNLRKRTIPSEDKQSTDKVFKMIIKYAYQTWEKNG